MLRRMEGNAFRHNIFDEPRWSVSRYHACPAGTRPEADGPSLQVQRCSGTAILSARRQSRALAGAGGSPATGGLPGSPLHLPGDAAVAQLDMGAAESGGDGRGGGGGGSGELGSLMEEGSGADSTGLADDEEFAVEAEAHRCRGHNLPAMILVC